MFDTFFGLPLHPLVIHAVVIGAPLTAVMVIAYAVSARFRAWSGWLTAAIGTLTLVAAFVATSSGEALEKRVGESSVVEEHAQWGGTIPWVVLAVTALAWAMWFLLRRRAGTGAPAATERRGAEVGAVDTTGVFKIVAALAVVAAIVLAVDVSIVGHLGAEAVWQDTASQSASSGDSD